MRSGQFLASLLCGSVGVALACCLVGCGASSTHGSSDSGTPKDDTGSPADTGTKPDTGTKADSGTKSDAGAKPDSGTADSGGGGDTGTPSDAGAGFDASPPPTGDAGIGAATDADTTACALVGSATCALLAKCNVVGLNEEYGSSAECVARETINCEIALLAPNSGQTGDNATACATAEGTETCVQDLDFNPPSACLLPAGTVANGSPCSHSAQCASAFCSLPLTSLCGVCAPPLAAGDPCTALSTCGQTLTCANDVCTTFVTTVGATCGAGTPCGVGLDCVIPGTMTSGTCQAEATMVGQACDPTFETGASCDANLGLYCVGATKKCATVAYAETGKPCGEVGGVRTYCIDGNCIKAAGDAGARTCVEHAADHAACNTASGPTCLEPSRCVGTVFDGGVSGTCELPAQACP